MNKNKKKEKDKSIRIVGGMRKGRKLRSLPGLSTRPLMRRVKQSLFDILDTKVDNSDFLDLYAGTGSVGIEALSRGAKSVMFIEKESQCIRVIRTNIRMCDWEDRAEIIQEDMLDYFKKDRKFQIDRHFDLIFIGAPYKLNLTGNTLSTMDKFRLLTNDGWIICQHHFKEKIPESLGGSGLCLFRQEKYGKTMLSFYKYE